MKKSLVVIGNGMAGVATVEEILKKTQDLEIILFGAERHVNYNRILLSGVLAGEAKPEEIVLNPPAWYEEHGIRLHLGVPVTGIARTRKAVTAEGGLEVPYDQLLLATGSHPFIPPIQGVDKAGVLTFRNLDDTLAILSHARKARKALVIGGGLLGLEAARGLVSQGLEVTVVHLMDRLMEMQLDDLAADMVQAQIQAMGIQVLLNQCAVEIVGNGTAEGVRFKDGSAREADLVLIATGIKPNVDLAKAAGLRVSRGVVVDDYLQTSDPWVYAVGECAEHRGKTYGLVAPLMEQAKVAAEAMAGEARSIYRGTATQAKLKVAGVNVVSMGNFLGDGAGLESVTYQDPSLGIYKKLVLQGGRVAGGILVGDIADSGRIFHLLKNQADITLQRSTLLMGEPAVGDAERVAALGPEDTVCGCMGVTKGEIVRAIQDHELTHREGVAAKTKACTSCKSCGPFVDQILQEVLGGELVLKTGEKHFCSCVPLSKAALRTEIRVRNLRSASQVLHDLGNGVGCVACRPGLAYLVSEVWKGAHVEERASRFINDRVHANIQKDGTFSVVPRMYGGVTSPEELRRIADVAERYGVRMVKLTGGARVDLLGVPKADLPRIWADLGLPSGHAYAKAIRTCKSCVGSTFCRFGVQDSMTMAIEMEKAFEGLYTPHKTKMAVSGCPRNCTEATVKDIGVVGIQNGWEVYVGGAAGMSVRKGDLLGTYATPKETMEAAALFLQHYREEAEYMERTYGFVERVGIEKIKKVLFEKGSREPTLILERFQEARAAAREPWKTEGEHPVHPKQFMELEPVG